MMSPTRTSRTRFFASLGAVCCGGLLAAQESQEAPPTPIEPSEVSTLGELVDYVRQGEKAVDSVAMEIESTGRFPDGSEFRTTGSLRVLGTTHFHSKMRARLGGEMEAETETVRTPEGIWMRERDPAQGEIFLRMDRPTMERVDSAAKFLGDDPQGRGFGQRESQSPLGSAVLEDLQRQFDLALREPRTVDGQRVWVVSGPLKDGLSAEDEAFGVGADRVDLLVRVLDGAVIQMTQLREGRPLLEVRIPRLEFDRPFDPSSFTLEVPDNAQVIDVMDHPPARQQILRMLEEARQQGWVDPAGGDAPATVEGDARDGK